MPSTVPYATLATASVFTGAELRKDSAPTAAAATDFISAGTGRIAYIELDNSANSADSYLKIYNVAAASVTVGTTVPWIILRARANAVLRINVIRGLNFSATSLSYSVVTTPGTGGATGPVSATPLKLDTIS